MDVILVGVIYKCASVYLNDIMVFTMPPEKHIDHANQVLTRLQRAGITLKSKKRIFYMDKIGYLGHVIIPRRLDIAAPTADAFQKLIESCITT